MAAPSRRQDVIVATVAVVALAAAGFLVVGNGPPANREVFLTAATASGNDPFTPPVVTGTGTSPPPAPSPSATPSPSASVSASAVPTPAATPLPSPGNAPSGAVDGSTPGLYGGTRNAVVCDKQKMIDYLRANPAKEQAWGQAQGIGAADVPSFVSRLTPVLLRYDTRVTNHGFVNGYANPYVDVMQAGTAVLVDQFGVPRARCYCGNPLTPPVALQGTPATTGAPWSSYQPSNVVIVQPAPQPQTSITVVDTATNQAFPMPVGGTPPKPPVPAPRPSASPAASASPSASASPTATPTASPGPVPAGDHYALTFTGSKAFGQFIDDSGHTATVTQASCDSVESGLGGGTDVVISITGSSLQMTFQDGVLTGTYNRSDATFDAKSQVMPRDGSQAGVTVSFSYESRGTLANGSMSNAAIREILNEQPDGGSLVSGGCDFLVTGAKV